MKTVYNSRNHPPGLTLIELTLVISVMLAIIAVSMIGARQYVKGVERASCLIQQDVLQKRVMADANLNDRPLQSGIDYYSDPASQHIFKEPIVCPEGHGTFTCIYDSVKKKLVVICTDHPGEHHKSDG